MDRPSLGRRSDGDRIRLSTSVCQLVPSSTACPGVLSPVSRALLACPYAAPSPRTSTSRPSCCHPRYAVRCFFRDRAVTAGGLDSAAKVGGSNVGGCPHSGRLSSGCAEGGHLGSGGGGAGKWGASRASVGVPGRRPSPTSWSPEADDPDCARGFAWGSGKTPPPCRARSLGPSGRRSGGSRDSCGLGALVSQASVD